MLAGDDASALRIELYRYRHHHCLCILSTLSLFSLCLVDALFGSPLGFSTLFSFSLCLVDAFSGVHSAAQAFMYILSRPAPPPQPSPAIQNPKNWRVWWRQPSRELHTSHWHVEADIQVYDMATSAKLRRALIPLAASPRCISRELCTEDALP